MHPKSTRNQRNRNSKAVSDLHICIAFFLEHADQNQKTKDVETDGMGKRGNGCGGKREGETKSNNASLKKDKSGLDRQGTRKIRIKTRIAE